MSRPQFYDNKYYDFMGTEGGRPIEFTVAFPVTEKLKGYLLKPNVKYLVLNPKDVEDYIISRFSQCLIDKLRNKEGVDVEIHDIDTHEIITGFRLFHKDGVAYLNGDWGIQFARRRNLMAGDEIGFRYHNYTIQFSVLSRNSNSRGRRNLLRGENSRMIQR